MVFKFWKSAYNKITDTTRHHAYSEVPQDEATTLSSPAQVTCHQFLRLLQSIMFFLLVSFTIFVFFYHSEQGLDLPANDFTVVRLMLPDSSISPKTHNNKYKKIQGDVRKRNMYTGDLKYILLWSGFSYCPFDYLGKGQKAFLKNNCSVIKCYVTRNRKLFGGDLKRFDAIAFHGRSLGIYDLPSHRSPHQRYIYFNMESAVNYPACDATYDGFFNWTSTYRLNSDIPIPYILIRDKKGEIVGPKREMQWKEDMETVGDKYAGRILNKTKAVAWFVSNCHARSARIVYVKTLNKALRRYGTTIDVYGKCGNLTCPRKISSKCNYRLKHNYFFYLSMENSFDEDYVTEKLLTAVQNDVVPIVYGGADYARFLPPGSYINAREQNVTELAAMIKKLMHSPTEYSQYFRWKQHYTYHDPHAAENLCAICEALHNTKMLQNPKVYNHFQNWWMKNRCKGPD